MVENLEGGLHLDDVLRRAASLARPARRPAPVPEHDVALLVGELGRPLPASLVAIWRDPGPGDLGRLVLWRPGEIAAGLPASERHLEQGLLPFATGPAGDPWLIDLAGGADPDVIEIAELPPAGRTRLGPLRAAVRRAALAAILEAEPDAHDREALEAELSRLRQ